MTTVKQLRAELRDRGLPTTGNKTTLESRLKKYSGRAYYQNWTIPRLKTELARRQLSNTGAKSELITRLREDDHQVATGRIGIALSGNRDIDRMILLRLTIVDIGRVWGLCQYTAELCRLEDFWRDKIIRDYGANLKDNIPPGCTFRLAYRDLCKARPEDLLILAAEREYLPLLDKLLTSTTHHFGSWAQKALEHATAHAKIGAITMIIRRCRGIKLTDGAVKAAIDSDNPLVVREFIRIGAPISRFYRGLIDNPGALTKFIEYGLIDAKISQTLNETIKALVTKSPLDQDSSRRLFISWGNSISILVSRGIPILDRAAYQEARYKLAYMGITIPELPQTQ